MTTGRLRAQGSTLQHTWNPFRPCQQQNGRGPRTYRANAESPLTHALHIVLCISLAGKEMDAILVSSLTQEILGPPFLGKLLRALGFGILSVI